MMPFSYEALVLCAFALGVSILGEMTVMSRNLISALINFYLFLFCGIGTVLYGVRWFTLL